MDNTQAIATLNSLIETLKDGEEGFRTAADGLTDPQTKATFHKYSRERAQMAQELQAEVRALGGDPEKAGSVAGSVHRGWINIKSAVTGKNDASIIAEAERGEDIAKKAYEEASRAGLPTSASAVVSRQATQV
ncbi:MAG: PA2169 family four-helix-bundle protein, partial [Vicinamibacterales bacterium]